MSPARSRTKPRARRGEVADGTVAFVYLRISVEAELAVARQEKKARALCKARDWPVAATYTDDGVSAYNGDTRPAFDRMLSDAAAHPGPVVIVAWDLDRLVRRVKEVGRLIDLYEDHAVPFVTVQGGVDLTSAAGKLIAYVLTAVAEMESEHKAERLRLRYEQDRENGRPHWSFRPFGFERVGEEWQHHPSEAPAVRKMYSRFVKGDPLRTIADWLNAEGITQPERTNRKTGEKIARPFTFATVRKLLRAERNAGLMPDGATPGAWAPIVDAETFARAARLLDVNADTYTGAGNTLRHLLAGMLWCEACGARMTSHKKSTGKRSYLCRRDRGGCGVAVAAEPVDAIVGDAVTSWLADAGNRDALVLPADEEPQGVAALREIVAACGAKRAELLSTVDPALGVTKAHVAPALRAIAAEEKAAVDRLAKVRTATPVEKLPTDPAALAEGWAGLAIEEQRAIIADVLEPVRIRPAVTTGRSFDPSRVAWSYRYPVAA